MRNRSRMAITAVAWLAGTTAVPAQGLDMDDPAFVRAAVVVVTFDYFAAACGKARGFKPADVAVVEGWQTANGVNRIRARIREVEQDPTQKKRVDQARAFVTNKVAGQGVEACAAALAVTRLPDAQVAAVSRRLVTPPSPPAQTQDATEAVSAATSSPSEPPTATNPTARADFLAQIEGFGFDSRVAMGVGGFLTTDIYPVVLFRSGEALTDVARLGFAGGLEANRRANPRDWTRWRRNGDKLELAGKSGWTAMSFRVIYTTLPNDFRLDGAFSSLSGVGTVAIGGTDSVTAWRQYHFSKDGRIEREGGAGGRAEFGDASVVTKSVAPNRRGRYRIDGLTLHITYDDGSSESRILIADPADPKGAIWLDGVGYAQRR
jgi:hypothetical protein